MADKIEIEAKRFIGEGRLPWLLCGRIHGQDDDTAVLVLADDEGLAQETFKKYLVEIASDDEGGEGQEAATIYINQSEQLF